MTPGEHIEEIRKKLDTLLDEHPIGRSGWMEISDLRDALYKLECVYNQDEINKNSS